MIIIWLLLPLSDLKYDNKLKFRTAWGKEQSTYKTKDQDKVYSKKLDQEKKTDQENRQNYTVRHQIRTTEKCKTMDQDNREM